MISEDHGWPTIGALLAALAIVLLWMFGDLAKFLYAGWIIAVAGLGCLYVALRRGRKWWLLIFLPLVSSPLIVWGALLYECGRGNCL